jgi:hypothetical protein
MKCSRRRWKVPSQASERGWCVSVQQLDQKGCLSATVGCRFRFIYGVLPRCSVCPLFDAERAIRDVLGENPPPPNVLEITLGPDLRALLQGELLSSTEEHDLDLEIPDFPPEGWGEPGGQASG